jgi:hypothetical protein
VHAVRCPAYSRPGYAIDERGAVGAWLRSPMPNYSLNSLGATEFERLSQALIKAVIGQGTITFGAGPDGNREATFIGSAPYPSASDEWQGAWIFQAKYHDLDILGPDKARAQLIRDLRKELDVISATRPAECDNYILITNVPLTSVPASGTHDLITTEAAKYSSTIPHIHVWGYDEVCRFLDTHGWIRHAYAQFLTPGDVIARLLGGPGDRSSAVLDEAVKLYLATDYRNERFAQLDQAGDVGDESLPLAKVFVDIDVILEARHHADIAPLNGLSQGEWRALRNPDTGLAATRIVLRDALKRLVLIGGPGQGKSTLGQFTAQVHRAALLGRLRDVIGTDDGLIPVKHRIPFRVVLREYAQWVGRSPDSGMDRSDELLAITVESYLAERVGRLAARPGTVTPDQVQNILRSNPTLLIFDGLDEVVDPSLRSKVLAEIADFLERTDAVLNADIQIIGSSRPTGYSGEFQPSKFVHLRLQKLTAARANEYVDKWLAVRGLDEAREVRVRTGFKESVDDMQLKLLLTTPLQVGIVIYVILAGGRPSRQRESLFTDYVDVIYKRERAKHRSILTTEKDVLIGLHQYLGYLVHARAGQATHVRSALTEQEFRSEVEVFLRHDDPYKGADEMAQQVDILVREARDRLVLIVEGSPGYFGFELRSLQEYFAASHIVETAADSDQRYERFAAIATSTHWRNAALFFAGRVSRSSRGEAAQLIDACRETDTVGPDVILRRGCLLARDLALDRAFGPNRRLQRSALEECIGIVEADPVTWEPSEIGRELSPLSDDDVKEHVLPALDRKVEALGTVHQLRALEVYGQLPRWSDVPLRLMRRYEGKGGSDLLAALRIAVSQRWSVDQLHEAIKRCRLELGPGAVASLLGPVALDDPTYVIRATEGTGMGEEEAIAIAEAAIADQTFHFKEDGVHELRRLLDWEPSADVTARMLGKVLILESLIQGFGFWLDPRAPGWKEADVDLRDEVRKIVDRLDAVECEPAVCGELVELYRVVRDATLRLMWSSNVLPITDAAERGQVGQNNGIMKSIWLTAFRNGHPAAPLYGALADGGPATADVVSLANAYVGEEGEARWHEVAATIAAEGTGLQRLGLAVGDRRLCGDLAEVWEARTGASIDVVGPIIFAGPPAAVLDDDERLEALRSTRSSLEAGDVRACDRFVQVLATYDAQSWGKASAVRLELLSISKEAAAAPLGRTSEDQAAIAGVATVVESDEVTEDVLAVVGTIGARAMPGEVGGDTSLWAPSIEPHRTAAKFAVAVADHVAPGRSVDIWRGSARCILALVTSSIGRLDGDSGEGLPLEVVRRFLMHDDDLVRRAGIALLPQLREADCASGVTAAIGVLAGDTGDELRRVWGRSARTMHVPGSDNLRAELIEVLAEVLATEDLVPTDRRAGYSYMRRVANSQEPQILSREADLGLPLSSGP